MQFSIIVCCYNATLPQLKYTLDSILKQSINDYEIIIADDGSINNNNEFLLDYFKEKDFENYYLALNNDNMGTVKNIMSGLAIAKGEYVKPIGAGDALAQCDIIELVYDKMKEKHAKLLFCELHCFSIINDEIKIWENKSIPLIKKCYKSGIANKKAYENIVVFNDQISGASIFYETVYFTNLLKKIIDKVKYIEDLVQYFAILDDEPIYFLDIKGVYYEMGTGISTSHNSDSNIRMRSDKNTFLDIIFDEYPDNLYIKRRKRLEYIERDMSNKCLKICKKIVSEPKWIWFKFLRLLQ